MPSKTTDKFKYGGEEIAIPKSNPTIKALADWPSGWVPMTRETYTKLCAWRRDRSKFHGGKANYTPTLETHLKFGVRQKADAFGVSIGFPYMLHSRIENVKVLEITVDLGEQEKFVTTEFVNGVAKEMTKIREWRDFKGKLAANKKGKLEPIRKYSTLEGTPKSQDVLFGLDVLPEPQDDGELAIAHPLKDVFITEGEWDAMAFHEQGFHALSVLNASQRAVRPAVAEMLVWFDHVWLALDSDKPGRACSKAMLLSLPFARELGSLGRYKDACEHAAQGGLKLTIKELTKPRPDDSVAAVVPKIEDMPETVLDGWLGELCKRRLGSFPKAYAWPALVTVAGALTPPMGQHRTALYTDLVGDVNSGKSKACEHALYVFGLNPEERPAEEESPIMAALPSVLVAAKVPSAEGLAVVLGDAGSNHRLWYPGEIKHALGKAMIQNASFPTVLCDAYYQNLNKLMIAEQKWRNFNCELSILGTLVADGFGEVYGSESLGGLYDRTTFGLQPSGVKWDFRPFEGSAEQLPDMSTVSIDSDVWAERDRWQNELGIGRREAEMALRVALICAAFDRRKLLCAEDLEPALAFARYQTRVRLILRPNIGQTNEAKIADAVLGYLKRHAPNGQWLPRRKVFWDTNVYKLGPILADRVLTALEFNREIECREFGSQKQRQIRLVKHG